MVSGIQAGNLIARLLATGRRGGSGRGSVVATVGAAMSAGSTFGVALSCAAPGISAR